jgi:hypothetical protein
MTVNVSLNHNKALIQDKTSKANVTYKNKEQLSSVTEYCFSRQKSTTYQNSSSA